MMSSDATLQESVDMTAQIRQTMRCWDFDGVGLSGELADELAACCAGHPLTTAMHLMQ